MTEVNSGTDRSQRRARRIKRLVVGSVIALTAGIGVAAWADGRDGGCGRHGMGGPGMMHDHGGPGMFWGSGRGVDRMLDGLGVSEAQRAQIRQITQAAASDAKSRFDANRALRDKTLQLLTAPTVDAAAVESVRQQMLAQHDQMSQRMTQTMIAVANVLTPEQRAKFAERVKMRQDTMRERMQRHQGASAPKTS